MIVTSSERSCRRICIRSTTIDSRNEVECLDRDFFVKVWHLTLVVGPRTRPRHQDASVVRFEGSDKFMGRTYHRIKGGKQGTVATSPIGRIMPGPCVGRSLT